MKKLIIPILAAMLTGCTTIALSERGSLKGIDVKGADGKAERTLCIGNEGYFFFAEVPLFSGDMSWQKDRNGLNPYGLKLFSDETSLQRMTDAFYRYAERENSDVVDLVVDAKTYYPIGLTGIPQLIANFITVEETFITGVLKPRK